MRTKNEQQNKKLWTYSDGWTAVAQVKGLRGVALI